MYRNACSPYTVAIPSMNAWGLGVMVLVLGLAGWVARRRKMI
ncbi:MAG: IPTL-CTERM sorting domain-containing protein [Proteobacteria bacterium]|nr:IPTL-CTERM sorting domain-containing protein [Pseudomonadota bacterium]